jgi:sugar diacid utilization regulator
MNLVRSEPLGDLETLTGDRRLIDLAARGVAPHGIDCADLHKLTLLSMLMTDRDEDQIVGLALATVPTLAPVHDPVLHLGGRDWRPASPPGAADLLRRLGDGDSAAPILLASRPGDAHDPDAQCTYAIPVRSLALRLGHLLVSCSGSLAEDQLFPLQVLTQQLAVALDNARRHAREALMVAELGAVNTLLARNVEELRRVLRMHEQLTGVATRGSGMPGIVTALTELTGRPAAIEDAAGVVRAATPGWCTTGRRDSPAARERLLGRLHREPRPVRDRDRLVSLAGRRPDPVALLLLADPDGSAGEYEQLVLEYAGTVLAMELARSASVAEAELRLRRDLVEELLLGLAEPAARARAGPLGIDLDLVRRVVVVSPVRPLEATAGTDRLLHVVRRVLHDLGDACLLITRGATVVCLAGTDVAWTEALRAIRSDPAGGPCWVGVGSACDRVTDIPTSLRHAHQALGLTRRSTRSGGVVSFDDLGVYRLLALNNDTAELDSFVDRWLGPLLEYDATRSAGLVRTLTSYLQTGGSLAATAADLTVHRSTVKYRLQRVRELTAYDLADPATLFSLQLATYALQTRHALLDEPPGTERN